MAPNLRPPNLRQPNLRHMAGLAGTAAQTIGQTIGRSPRKLGMTVALCAVLAVLALVQILVPARDGVKGLRYTPASAADLALFFDERAYAWPPGAESQDAIPRLFVTRLPRDLSDLASTDDRKSLFFRAVLPLVLAVNDELRRDRARLLDLMDSGAEDWSEADQAWFAEKLAYYRLTPDEHDLAQRLAGRMDELPVSLALAQAAEESGWGTSRFARQGNALFGQWTTDGPGLVPGQRREGADHKVRAFPSLLASVRSYMRNLNSHRAYADFRQVRQSLRHSGRAIKGALVVHTLTAYSERGDDYVTGLLTIMRANDLERLDDLRLALEPVG
ncbi:MAG: glucosaminidase domain-containing protein [Rhodospirillales bacterium]